MKSGRKGGKEGEIDLWRARDGLEGSRCGRGWSRWGAEEEVGGRSSRRGGLGMGRGGRLGKCSG